MPQGFFDETKATARLPNLDIEIVRIRSPAGDAECITISLQAAPAFAALGRFLEATSPLLFWMRFAQTAWAPRFGVCPAKLPPKNFDRLPPAAETRGIPHRIARAPDKTTSWV
jgi:hypothetical protein